MPDRGLLLVTGASGFLGRAIVRVATAAGWPVRAFAHEWSAPIDGVECLTGDVTDGPAVGAAFEGATHVIHAAGLAHQFKPVPEQRFFEVNTRGTAVVARAAVERRVARIVLISSVSVYGGGRGVIGEDAACVPRDAYAKSKLAAEHELLGITGPSGVSAIVLRPATLFGEGDPGNVRRLIGALASRRFVAVGPGTNLKSLLYRDDAARACIAAVEAPGDRAGVYNVADAPVAMRDIVQAACAALGRPSPVWHVPVTVARGGAAVLDPLLRLGGSRVGLRAILDKWLGDDAYDGSRFARSFPWRPAVSVEEGLRREVRWLRAGGGATP